MNLIIPLAFQLSSFILFAMGDLGKWHYDGEDSKGKKYYSQTKYNSKKGNRIIVWVKVLNKLPEEVENQEEPTAYTLQLIDCNCSNYSLKFLSLIDYSENNSLIKSYNFNDNNSSFIFPPPESIGISQLKDICKRFAKK